jgi:transcriptional regulator with XRE-family HTH domain
MSKSANELRKKLRRLRDERGALAEVAKRADMKPQAIYRLISDDAEIDPSLSTLDRIASALDEKPWDLINPDTPQPTLVAHEPSNAELGAWIKAVSEKLDTLPAASSDPTIRGVIGLWSDLDDIGREECLYFIRSAVTRAASRKNSIDKKPGAR